MYFTPSSLLLLVLPLTASADILQRYQCYCTGPGISGYYLEYQYQASRVQNQVFSVSHQCSGNYGGCPDQDTYYISFDRTVGDHTFKYHRDQYSSDDYEFDGSGERGVPTDQAIVLDGAKEYCTSVCKYLNPDLGPGFWCDGGDEGRSEGCKAEMFMVPDL